MKKILIAALVIILLVLGITATTTKPNPTTTEPIKIGLISPLSGGVAVYGEPFKNGFTLAVEEINAQGGIDGRMIEVVTEDSKCDGKTALTATQKLVNINQVKFLVGAVCSTEVLGALPFTEESKIVFLGLVQVLT